MQFQANLLPVFCFNHSAISDGVLHLGSRLDRPLFCLTRYCSVSLHLDSVLLLNLLYLSVDYILFVSRVLEWSRSQELLVAVLVVEYRMTLSLLR